MSLIRKEVFVEFRFDLLSLTLEQVRKVVRESDACIATCRPGVLDEAHRMEILKTAIQSGADYIDIEVESDPAYLEELLQYAGNHGTTIIISYHNFETTPDLPELESIVEQCLASGADVVKIASQVNETEDLRNLFKLYRKDLRMVIIGMGEQGIISRIAAPLLGAEFTFAAPEGKPATAPGQLSRNKLLSILRQIQE
jgi:3-dehydroquinate dehydratase type I